MKIFVILLKFKFFKYKKKIIIILCLIKKLYYINKIFRNTLFTDIYILNILTYD